MLKIKLKQGSAQFRDFWTEYYNDIVLGAIVFLLIAAAFGIGFVVGGRFYEQAAITINCPESFWQQK